MARGGADGWELNESAAVILSPLAVLIPYRNRANRVSAAAAMSTTDVLKPFDAKLTGFAGPHLT